MKSKNGYIDQKLKFSTDKWLKLYFEKRHCRGPWNCRCQTLRERVLGDGCDICNPELAKELENE